MENLESVCVWIINTHFKWLSQLQRLNEKGSTVWNTCIHTCVCVCIYTHIYTTDTQLTLLIICTIGLGKVYVNGNFLNHSFTRRYTYQTMCSQFSWFNSLWFSQTPHILTYLPVTDYSHKSTVLLTPKIIHIYQVYKKYVHNLKWRTFFIDNVQHWFNKTCMKNTNAAAGLW